LHPITINYNAYYNRLQCILQPITMATITITVIRINLTTIYNHLQSITITFMTIYIHLQQLLKPITIISTTIYNRFDNQLQWHCNKILGTVHNGLSTEADGLLTKVQATGACPRLSLP
jgi:hypothetical protein